MVWGLLSERPRALRAAVIGGVGAICNLVGIVVLLMVMGGKTGILDQAIRTVVQQDLASIVEALEDYHEAEAAYPETLALLQRRRGALRPLDVADRGAGLLEEQHYQYIVSPDGRTYDLFSVGHDGTPGTGDDIRPVLADSLRAKAGYRPP